MASVLRRRFPVIKARRVRDAADIAALADYPADAVLLDAYVDGAHGGTGVRFDHALLATHRPSQPVVLAGGLRPDNVAEAVRATRPFAVDTSSGVESAPGVKDHALLAAFVAAVRAAG